MSFLFQRLHLLFCFTPYSLYLFSSYKVLIYVCNITSSKWDIGLYGYYFYVHSCMSTCTVHECSALPVSRSLNTYKPTVILAVNDKRKFICQWFYFQSVQFM